MPYHPFGQFGTSFGGAQRFGFELAEGEEFVLGANSQIRSVNFSPTDYTGFQIQADGSAIFNTTLDVYGSSGSYTRLTSSRLDFVGTDGVRDGSVRWSLGMFFESISGERFQFSGAEVEATLYHVAAGSATLSDGEFATSYSGVTGNRWVWQVASESGNDQAEIRLEEAAIEFRIGTTLRYQMSDDVKWWNAAGTLAFWWDESTDNFIFEQGVVDQVLFPEGTNAAPSIAIDTDTDLGFFRFAANQMGLAANALVIEQASGANAFVQIGERDSGGGSITGYIEFNTSGANIDRDARIQVFGGDGSVDGARMELLARSLKPPVATSNPTTSGAEEGDIYINTSANELRVYNGTSWVTLASY